MEGVVPDSVMEAVKLTSSNIEQFETQFLEFLPLCDPEVLAELDPIQRAQSLLLFAKATTTLFALKLRCSGVNPDEHPIKSELDRLSLYQDKLEKNMDVSKAPLKPSATLNPRAAARFIGHSLPDLTPEQKKSIRNISRGQEPTIKYVERNANKKRKCLPMEKQSVQAAAQEFLENATRELLGDKKDGFKGPLQPRDSDEEMSG